MESNQSHIFCRSFLLLTTETLQLRILERRRCPLLNHVGTPKFGFWSEYGGQRGWATTLKESA